MRLNIDFIDHAKIPTDESFKFVYFLESPSSTTIGELTEILSKYISRKVSKRVEIVRLRIKSGFSFDQENRCDHVLRDDDEIQCVEMRQFSADNYTRSNHQELWVELKQHDVSDDREKSLEVGLTYNAELFVHLNAEQGLYSLNIFSVYDLIRIANEKRQNSLIYRFDQNDDQNPTTMVTNTWFVEAKWKYNGQSNDSLFLICTLKIGTSEDVSSNQIEILLDRKENRFQKGQISILSALSDDLSGLNEEQRTRLMQIQENLPSAKRSGPEIQIPRISSAKLPKHECEGDSSIRMVCGNTNTVIAYQDRLIRDEQSFVQIVTMTHVIFSKKTTILPEILQQKRSAPAEKPVAISTLTVLYQTHDGGWQECIDVAIAPIPLRNEEPRWLTDPVINVEPDKLTSYTIRASVIGKGQIGRDNAGRQRVHKTFPQPFKLKIVLKDNFDRHSSLVIEQMNKPLDLATCESFARLNASSINHMLGFVHVDDCVFDERIYIAIFIDRENRLVIRNSIYYAVMFDRKALRTMEFNAKKNNQTEMALDQLTYDSQDIKIKVFILIDPQIWILYALRVELSSKTSLSIENVPIPIEKIE